MRVKRYESLFTLNFGQVQTDRQKVMHTSPPFNMHGWAQKAPSEFKRSAYFCIVPYDTCYSLILLRFLGLTASILT